MTRYAARDDGISLIELTIVLALTGVILASAWLAFSTTARGSSLSNQNAGTSREIGQPLEHAERVFTQQFSLLTVERYVCECYTDRDSDGRRERYRFEATTDGRLVVTSTEEFGSTTPLVQVWSYNNRNRATGTPLFTYLDEDGHDISGEPSDDIKQYARSLKVTIATEFEGMRLTDSRQMLFRNR